jgi:hypothetical protein
MPGSPEVRDHLGGMDRGKGIDGFQFHHQGALNEEIQPGLTYRMSFVVDRNKNLSEKANTTQRKLNT